MKYILLTLIAVGVCAHLVFALRRRGGKKNYKPAAKQRVARVMCGGTQNVAARKYEYDGVGDCAAAAKLFDGPKSCKYGCVGLGSCAAVCPSGAIHIIGGTAAVDSAKCRGCGKCAEACPKNIIELVPKNAAVWVGCSSCAARDETVENCNIGCDACGECVKVCEKHALQIENGRARINYDLCDFCGKCAQACARKTIWTVK